MAEIKLNAEDVYTAVNTINGNIADMSSMAKERYLAIAETIASSEGDFKSSLAKQIAAEIFFVEKTAELLIQATTFIEKSSKSFETEDQDVGSQIK